jgi:hypothetical protein
MGPSCELKVASPGLLSCTRRQSVAEKRIFLSQAGREMQKYMAKGFESLNGLAVRTGFILSSTGSNGSIFILEKSFQTEYQAGIMLTDSSKISLSRKILSEELVFKAT